MKSQKEVTNKVIQNVHICSILNIKVALEHTVCLGVVYIFFVKGGFYYKSRYLRTSLGCFDYLCGLI
jgi:hypothetical protein